MNHESNPDFKGFNIGETVSFAQLDNRTVVERAQSSLGPGHYLVKISDTKALPVLKDSKGKFDVGKGEIIMDPQRLMKVVGFLED